MAAPSAGTASWLPGMFYWLAPRLWKTKLYSDRLANAHFWIGFFGILLYVASMWVSGITQGLMLNGMWFFSDGVLMLAGICIGVFFSLIAIVHFKATTAQWSDWYERLLGNWAPFSILVFIAVAIGGMIQIVPTLVVQQAQNLEDRVQIPYTPLELAGRDIYIAEGCYNCHSQQIRMMKPDVLRYGEFSRLGESIYDHPFQWGSKRTGPDLAREGGKRPNVWHYDHMRKPTDISPGSNMPPYPWLLEQRVDFTRLPGKIAALRTLGVPYPKQSDEAIIADMEAQAAGIVEDLAANFRATEPDTQIVALIAYLQKLGASEDVESATARLAAANTPVPDPES
jgi:cytochrome c oxidase cbb3-type subunit I/II